jgi:hypothetical protein
MLQQVETELDWTRFQCRGELCQKYQGLRQFLVRNGEWIAACPDCGIYHVNEGATIPACMSPLRTDTGPMSLRSLLHKLPSLTHAELDLTWFGGPAACLRKLALGFDGSHVVVRAILVAARFSISFYTIVTRELVKWTRGLIPGLARVEVPCIYHDESHDCFFAVERHVMHAKPLNKRLYKMRDDDTNVVITLRKYGIDVLREVWSLVPVRQRTAFLRHCMRDIHRVRLRSLGLNDDPETYVSYFEEEEGGDGDGGSDGDGGDKRTEARVVEGSGDDHNQEMAKDRAHNNRGGSGDGGGDGGGGGERDRDGRERRRRRRDVGET